MFSNFVLSGENVLVTGASRGIGRHLSILMARHGAKVAISARQAQSLRQTGEEIAKIGIDPIIAEIDVSNDLSVQSAIADIDVRMGGITIVINNAGVALAKPAIQQSETDWDVVVDTNLKGTFLVAREAARRMSIRKAGNILNIASVVGDVAIGQLVPYAASKAGVIQMTKVMALEWARHNIRVNSISPGYIETEMNREHFESEKGREQLKNIALRRLGRVTDLDAPVLLLCSAASAYITGSNLKVDGGYGLR